MSDLDTLVKGKNVCVKCGNKVPFDKVGHNCEIIKCPKCSKDKEKELQKKAQDLAEKI